MSFRQFLSPRAILRELRDTERFTESITVIVVPSRGARPLRFAVPRIALFVVGGATAFSLLCLLAFLLWSGRVLFDAHDARTLRKDVARLTSENQRIVELEGTLRDLQAAQRKILAWAGLPNPAGSPADAAARDSAAVPVLDGVPAGSALVPGAGASDGALTADIVMPRLVPVPSAKRPGWRWPVNGWISHAYVGGDSLPGSLDEIHSGVDIIAPRDTPVLAASDGRVVFAGWDEDLGNMLLLDHDSGISTVYGHNASLLVTAGAYVTGGQAIARVGSTGRSSAPHLHFEVRASRRTVDPEAFLSGEWRAR